MLRAQNELLMQVVTVLGERVAELERALAAGGHGGGRGTPPPTRPPSGRPHGGQPGHKGNARPRPEPIDETQHHLPEACPRCGGAVEPTARTDERFEFEAVARTLRTIRHVLHRGWCPRCKRRVRPRVPFALPDSDYGPRAHAMLASLRATMGSTVGDLETFTRTVWRRPLSGGQIVAMLDRTAAALAPTFWWLIEQITHEPVVYEDATSWTYDGERAVVWVFTTRRITVYWIDSEGSGLVPRRALGKAIDGAVVSDEAERFQHVTHHGDQRCLAHPLRAARDLLAARPDCPEVVAMMGPLREHLAWMIALYGRHDQLAPSTWLHYRARARRELLRLARGPWRDVDCVRMAKRIEREVDLWVTYLSDDTGEMEPTNNCAERALRPTVIDRKRMQQSRSLGGVYREMVLRSLAATCKQLGVSFEEVVVEALLARTRDGPSPTPPATLVRALQAARQRSGRMTTDHVAAGV